MWKLLTYLDRILFCRRPGGRTTRRGGAKHRRTEPEKDSESGWSATISERIRLFAAGEWADLWRETVRVLTPRGTLRRQVYASRQRKAASVGQTRFGKKGSLLGLVQLHCRPKIHCVPMTFSTSFVTSSRPARMGTVCLARIRGTAWPTMSGIESCRQSRRSSVLCRVAPARARRARALSTG